MKTVIVRRFKITDKYAYGHCFVENTEGIVDYTGASLEKGWNDNKANISCIPRGTYELKYEYSNKFEKKLWEIYGVDGRSECKFHVAHDVKQLEGCIALGEAHVNFDSDPELEVNYSVKTLNKLHEMMGDDTAALLRIENWL